MEFQRSSRMRDAHANAKPATPPGQEKTRWTRLWIKPVSGVGYDALGHGIRCTLCGMWRTGLWDTVHANMGYGARYPQVELGCRPRAVRGSAG